MGVLGSRVLDGVGARWPFCVGYGARYSRLTLGFVGSDVYVDGYCCSWWSVGTCVGKFVVGGACVVASSLDGFDDLGVVFASWFRHVGMS